MIQNQSENNGKNRPNLDPKFVITIEGKEFVTYQGLLDVAHRRGLIRIETEILQYPSDENGNTAVVRAVAEKKASLSPMMQAGAARAVDLLGVARIGSSVKWNSLRLRPRIHQ